MTDNVAHLPVKARKPEPRHAYGQPVFVPQDPERGRPYPQTERTCAACKLVKITVHGKDGGAWREWRFSGHAQQFGDAGGAPPCLPSTEAGA